MDFATGKICLFQMHSSYEVACRHAGQCWALANVVLSLVSRLEEFPSLAEPE